MSSIDSFSHAFEDLRRGFEAGRLAHAYLVIGSPRGNALALTESFLQLLFCREKVRPCGACAECRRIKEHAHPDVFWLEPESKSRRIVIGDDDRVGIRDMTRFIAVSPLTGNRKVGVIVHADRMTEQASNAFLKTLEEPSATSLLLLLTDSAQHLLPTIVSRCQRVVLSPGAEEEDEAWRKPVLDILRRGLTADSLIAMVQSGRLKAVLKDVEKAVRAEEETGAGRRGEEDEETIEARIKARVIEVRSAVLRQLLLWQRDVLLCVLRAEKDALRFPDEADVLKRQASGLTYEQAQRRLQAMDEVVRRLERNLPDELVFDVGLRVPKGP